MHLNASQGFKQCVQDAQRSWTSVNLHSYNKVWLKAFSVFVSVTNTYTFIIVPVQRFVTIHRETLVLLINRWMKPLISDQYQTFSVWLTSLLEKMCVCVCVHRDCAPVPGESWEQHRGGRVCSDRHRRGLCQSSNLVHVKVCFLNTP